MANCFSDSGIQTNAKTRSWTHNAEETLTYLCKNMEMRPQLSPPLIPGVLFAEWLKRWGCSQLKWWMNSRRAPSIATTALSTSIGSTPSPTLSLHKVLFLPLSVSPSAATPFSRSNSPHRYCKSFLHALFCCSVRLLVPPGTQPFTWAWFGHAPQPIKSPRACAILITQPHSPRKVRALILDAQTTCLLWISVCKCAHWAVSFSFAGLNQGDTNKSKVSGWKWKSWTA